MKLATIFVAAAFAENKKQPDPMNHPRDRLDKLKEHVQYISDTWLINADCSAGKKPETYVTKISGIFDRMASLFDRCAEHTDGADPPPQGILSLFIIFISNI